MWDVSLKKISFSVAGAIVMALSGCQAVVLDALVPKVINLSLTNDAVVGFINAAQQMVSRDLIVPPDISAASSLGYSVVLNTKTCDSTLTYLNTVPTNILTAQYPSGTQLKVCLSATSTAGITVYGQSDAFFVYTDLPTTAISGQPSGTSNMTLLNVTVSGAGVTTYKYKIGATASTDCSASSGYSSFTSVSDLILSDISLLPEGSVTLCAWGQDSYNNLSASPASATWTKDTIAPNAPTGFSATPANTQNTLAWSAGGGQTGYLLIKRVGSAVTWAPISGTSYVAGAVDGNHTAIYVGNSLSYPNTGLTNGTNYYYAVFAYDAAYNYSAPAAANGTPMAVPTFTSINLINDVADGYLNAAERALTNDLVGGLVASGNTSTGYAVVASATTCDAAVTYLGSVPKNNSGSMGPDSDYKICVDVSNVSGHAYGSSATFTLDTTAPAIASLAGMPSDPSRSTTLDVTVSGSGVTHYKSKVGPTASTDCANASGYSAAVAVATHISSDVSGYADGILKLCVLGIDIAGNPSANAQAYSWTKDTTAPTVPGSFVATGGNTQVSLTWIAGGGQTGYFLVRRASSAVTWSPTAGSSYSTGALDANHTLIYNGNALSYTDTGLSNGTTYYYAIFAYDSVYNDSTAATANASTLSPPTFTSIDLANDVVDGYLNSAERLLTNDLVTNLVASGNTSTGYAVVTSGTTCDAGVTYAGAIPKDNSGSFGSDGNYKVCVDVWFEI
jgi:hypothetical protein